MLAAVDFNHKLGPMRYKVGNAIPKADLPPEMRAFEVQAIA
jgi:hypothetical protein